MPNRPHRRPARSGERSPLSQDPVSAQAARTAGWTPAAQRHAIERDDIVRLRRGVFAVPSPSVDAECWQHKRDDHLLAARAAAVSSPRSALSHVGAALVLDLPVLHIPDRPCLTVPAGTALRRVANAHLHRATLSSEDVVQTHLGAVTAPARTIMDIAREFGVDAAVVTGDAALQRELVTHAELAVAFEQCAGWPGRKLARIALVSLDGRAESPLESLSRLRMRTVRLPAPQPQTWIYDGNGTFLGRSDFYWDEFGVVGEADGDLKYRDPDEITAERNRQKLFERAGLLVVRWGMRDLNNFAATAQQLREAFALGARPGSPRRRWLARPTPLHSPALLTRPRSAS